MADVYFLSLRPKPSSILVESICFHGVNVFSIMGENIQVAQEVNFPANRADLGRRRKGDPDIGTQLPLDSSKCSCQPLSAHWLPSWPRQCCLFVPKLKRVPHKIILQLPASQTKGATSVMDLAKTYDWNDGDKGLEQIIALIWQTSQSAGSHSGLKLLLRGWKAFHLASKFTPQR